MYADKSDRIELVEGKKHLFYIHGNFARLGTISLRNFEDPYWNSSHGIKNGAMMSKYKAF